MGRAPCCDKANVKRGPWSPEEDAKLKEYIDKHGTGGNWIALPQKAGLRRCGKSCRLRWLNYLRPNIRHGEFSNDEDRIISTLFANIGSRWSIIAAQLPGRTDNDIKNYWNTKLKKKLLMGSSSSLIMVPPLPHKIRPQYSSMTNYQPSISFLQSPSSSSSPPPYSSPSPHNTCTNNNNNNNYSSTLATTARSPFIGNYYDYDPSSMSNITPSSSNNQLLMHHLKTQDGFVSPMQNSYSQGKHSSPLIMFGDQTPAAAATDANSCSSSDGSNCNNKDQVEHEQQFMMFSNGATGIILLMGMMFLKNR